MIPGARAGRGAWVLELQGRRVELREGQTTVGRSRGCGVVVEDAAVSRGHARLRVQGERVTVQDLGSSNGTYLNGRRVEAEMPMAEGDRLTVGETQAYLRVAREGGAGGARSGPFVRAAAAEEQAAAAASGEATAPAPLLPPPPLPSLPLPVLGGAKALAASAPELAPAGFWPRAGAFALDAVAVTLAASILALPLGGPFTPRGSLLAFVVGCLLALFMPLAGWCLWGTTPGKHLLGLTVHGPDGRAGLSVGRALLRLAGYALSTLPLGAGFWMAAFSPTRRTLHDHLAGTSVLQAVHPAAPGTWAGRSG